MKQQYTWEIVVTVPFCELAEYLTDAEYESMKGVYNKDIEIQLSFDYSPEDKEVGIMFDSMEFNGDWSFCNQKTNCEELENAMQEFIDATDVDSRWGGKAYESYCDYCDYLRYGE